MAAGESHEMRGWPIRHDVREFSPDGSLRTASGAIVKPLAAPAGCLDRDSVVLVPDIVVLDLDGRDRFKA